MISKSSFIKLAKAYRKQEAYTTELLDKIEATAKKYGQATDFVGLPFDNDNLTDAVLDILGDDFSYFNYDCRGDFNAFNKKITMSDGSHPMVECLGDLYDFSVREGSLKDE